MVNIKEFNNIVAYLKATESEQVSYEAWFAQYKPKREKVVGPVTQWDEQWETFKVQWPKTRTVKELGSRGICNKDFWGGKEADLKSKYIKAVTSGKISVEELYHAGRSYIQNAIFDSIRIGKSELEFRSAMAPWFNQEKYLIWKDIALPVGIGRPVQMETEI